MKSLHIDLLVLPLHLHFLTRWRTRWKNRVKTTQILLKGKETTQYQNTTSVKWNGEFSLGKTDQWAGICKGQVLIAEIKCSVGTETGWLFLAFPPLCFRMCLCLLSCWNDKILIPEQRPINHLLCSVYVMQLNIFWEHVRFGPWKWFHLPQAFFFNFFCNWLISPVAAAPHLIFF